jgi:3-mercaptopyruvate sulfurtransferase SseA
MSKGYRRVRPLDGGLDGWAEAGHPIEAIDPAAVE